jgi:hypothetical protein
MEKLIVPFEGKKEAEIDTGGVFSFISYERLKKLLEKDCGCSPNEKITGLIITDNGIRIRIDTISL